MEVEVVEVKVGVEVEEVEVEGVEVLQLTCRASPAHCHRSCTWGHRQG